MTVLWLISSFFFQKYAAVSRETAYEAGSWTFLPFSVGLVLLLQFNTFLTGLSRFFHVVGTELSGTLFIFATGAVLINILGVLCGQARQRGGCFLAGLATWNERGPTPTLIVALFCISFGLYFMIAGFMPGLNGDEPHYLLMTQSLLQDGDLDINNNYVDRDYQAYMPGVLDRHVSIGRDGTRYSIHPAGLSILMVPAYYLGGYRGVVVMLNMLAALLSIQLFMLSLSIIKSRGWALFLWFLTSFSPPLLAYSCKVFPEIPAALCVAYSYRLIRKGEVLTKWNRLGLVLALAVLPWLQQRFILLTVLLTIYLLINTAPRKSWWLVHTLCVGGSLLGLLVFYFVLYGNPLPSAPYTSVGMHAIWSYEILLKHGFWGLLFDQEFGLLVYSPIFILIFGGLWIKFREDKVGCVFWVLMFCSVYLPAAGFTLKWFGSWAPMGRYMVGLVPLLVELCALVIRRKKPWSLVWTLLLLFYATIMISYQLVRRYDLWIGAETGQSKLLSSLTESTSVSNWFPTLITPALEDYLVLAVWIISLVVLNWVILALTSDKKKPGTDLQLEPGPGSPTLDQLRHISFGTGVFISWCLKVLIILFSLTIVLDSMHHRKPLSGRAESKTDAGRILVSRQSRTGFERQYTTYFYETNKFSGKGSRPADYIISGPYVSLPGGVYEVLVSLELKGPERPEKIVSIDVCTLRGHTIFTSRIIGAADFGATDVSTTISLYFQLDTATANIETRVFSYHAVDCVVRDITIRTTEQLTFLWQGRVLAQRGYYKQALSRLLQIRPDNNYLTTVFKELALIYQQLGFDHQALENFRLYRTVQPNDGEAAKQYGELLLKSGDRGEGIRLLQELQGIRNEDP